jgi:Putative polyhydroxyalkanoic acid system protein (PHA_gran_rgn)
MLWSTMTRAIQVDHPHRLTVGEARRRIEQAASLAADKYRLVCRWVGDVLEVLPPPGVAAGARGRLVLLDGVAHAEVVLPGPYRFVSGKVATRLARELDELLAC